MSLFNLKDSLLGNDDDANQFYLHQDSNFGTDTNHQNGFGLQQYGASNINHLQQQRGLGQPGANLAQQQQQQQQQQQLYRLQQNSGLPNVQSQENVHFLNSTNAVRQQNPFPTQAGIIGGNIGNNIPGRAVGDLSIGNGRMPGTVPDAGFNGLGRFSGHTGGQFNPLGGRNNDDYLGANDTDDFPALPSNNQLNKHDTAPVHLGGMLSGNNPLFMKDSLGLLDNNSGPGQSLSGSSLLNQTIGPRAPLPQQASHPNALYSTGLGGLGGVDNSTLSSNNSSLSGVTTSASIINSQTSVGSSLLGNIGINSSITGNSGSVGLTKDNRHGMTGLLETIRSTDKDFQLLALGTDLTTFGLNLNSVESLYTSFISPFTDGVPSDEPQYKTPQCYLMAHTPVLKTDHWSKLTVETLFYIFYQMPKDILQACAAQELYRRDWKYHGELRIWVKPNARADLMQPTQQFVYFDAKAWEQKYLNTAQIRGNLLAGLLPEEEIRVKVPIPGQTPEPS